MQRLRIRQTDSKYFDINVLWMKSWIYNVPVFVKQWTEFVWSMIPISNLTHCWNNSNWTTLLFMVGIRICTLIKIHVYGLDIYIIQLYNNDVHHPRLPRTYMYMYTVVQLDWNTIDAHAQQFPPPKHVPLIKLSALI